MCSIGTRGRRWRRRRASSGEQGGDGGVGGMRGVEGGVGDGGSGEEGGRGGDASAGGQRGDASASMEAREGCGSDRGDVSTGIQRDWFDERGGEKRQGVSGERTMPMTEERAHVPPSGGRPRRAPAWRWCTSPWPPVEDGEETQVKRAHQIILRFTGEFPEMGASE